MISTKPNDPSATRGRTHRVLPSPHGANVLPAFGELFLYGILMIGSIGIIVYALLSLSGKSGMLPLLLVGVLIGSGSWMRLATLSQTRIDTRAKQIRSMRGIFTLGKRQELFKLEDLVQIQVINKLVSKGRGVSPVRTYELNLAFSNGARLTVANYGRRRHCVADARLLKEATQVEINIVDQEQEA